ncbi:MULTISPECIES: flagellar assembly protein FliW [Paenibacillus]|uniref:flagellar assembly protein FliW n=1 Tax=Paenibacillus TaxID=44249 RepID=UPI00096F6F13|nr:flagellar assembly protein FliW [Paenibacillus odorifer]OME56484.1 flagellar assembly protein FliW [Paenibacillus odorifer]OME61873.1 flagellar assembly protein FliW [Paenibacillus odorifer]
MTPDYTEQNVTLETIVPVYLFPKGLPGFEDLKEYRLVEHNELFSLLSSIDHPAANFITVNPFDFVQDYEFILPEDIINEIGVENREDVTIRCIVTWHSDRQKTTANLLAPLILNNGNNKGKQIILQNTSYTTKHPLWRIPKNGYEGGDF